MLCVLGDFEAEFGIWRNAESTFLSIRKAFATSEDRMKYLFDFDGVLTDQTEEAHRVRALFVEQVERASGWNQARILELFAHAEQEMDRVPHDHGWRFFGRVSAFSNEDLFVRNNGLASCLDDWMARGKATVPGVSSFTDLSSVAYDGMLAETRSGKLKPIDPFSRTLMEGLLSRGHDVVVVSNSGTDRIVQLLESVGLQPEAHASNPRARLRVRGDARKFELGSEIRVRPVGPYPVDVSRPVYERILREEVPSAVIGDVFSLDLALPLELARSESPRFGGLRAYLRVRPYTPNWSREYVQTCAPTAPASTHLLEQLSDLLE